MIEAVRTSDEWFMDIGWPFTPRYFERSDGLRQHSVVELLLRRSDG